MKNILILLSLIIVSCTYTSYEKYIVEGDKTNVTIRYRGINKDRKLDENLTEIFAEKLPIVIDNNQFAVYSAPYVNRNKDKLYWEIEAYSESAGYLISRMEESGISNMTTNNYLKITSHFK